MRYDDSDFSRFMSRIPILYVEDEDTVRQRMAAFLGRRFTSVYTASDGKEGLSLFRSHRPAIVLTDIRMPVMDGLQMTEEILRSDPDVKVIVTTAHSDLNYLLKAVDLGIDGYLLKPIDNDKLGRALRKVVRQMWLEESFLRNRKAEAISTFAAGLAHDFNNILSVIIGNLDLARYELPEGHRFPDILSSIEESALAARDLVLKFISLTRARPVSNWQGSIGELLADSIEFILGSSSLDCETCFPDDLWPVALDRGQMNQVFLNILRNAGDAMPEGGAVRISVENRTMAAGQHPVLPEGDYVKVTVADRGTGISAQDLPLIFDPYFSTKDRGTQKGMGLGLSIAQSIVGKHGGHIQVHSEKGVGTTVDVWLPAVRPS